MVAMEWPRAKESKMTKEITWKTGDGRAVVFTVRLRTENIIGRDDFAGEITKPCCEIDYSATVAGKDVGGHGWLQTVEPRKVGSVTVVAGLGNLGISDEDYTRIMAAVDDIKASDYWQDWKRKEERAEEIEREYNAHVDRLEKMMNP